MIWLNRNKKRKEEGLKVGNALDENAPKRTPSAPAQNEKAAIR
jgi:hypothetical protein